MKYPEFILGIARDVLQRTGIQQGFNVVDFAEFLHTVQEGIVIRQRQNLDEAVHWGESYKGNRDVGQWLNYFIVENHEGRNIVNPYLRSREGNGESDLQGRGSLCPGGHMDFVDICTYILESGERGSVINMEASIIENVYREAFEEMTFFVDGVKFQAFVNEGTPEERLIATVQDFANLASLHFEGVIFDNSDNVGRLHIGVAMRLKLREGVTIGNREAALDFIPAVPLNDLSETYPHVTFENWSKIFAFHLVSTADTPLSRDLLEHRRYTSD
jgi:predicted NUDIX family phosphoesterase